ncbi:putative glyoxalase superfamily protein PhnB [Murinocardiopsis flavida]|uniref:Putative glyoxalase superfamily protein PhnB n=1 Tax=Murinocardiopsis flavida TaxID=645275 RepID=A0A2P8CLX0_9ACTN|nr:VOC family protein [Murinocardiopsis flavida]PSK85974.1 putative glyoxalase superfamily protein PhnB [Murinocardiopsis flavida]
MTPYIMVGSAEGFATFVEYVFGAEVRNVNRPPGHPERVMHAEALIGGSTVFFADSDGDGRQCREPFRPGGDPGTTHMWTAPADPDGAYARAVESGAVPVVPLAVQDDGGRFGGFADPFGTLWWVTAAA